MHKNSIAVLALFAAVVLAGCTLFGGGPAATATPTATPVPTPTLTPAEQQAYDQVESELQNIPETDSSGLENLLNTQ